MDVIGLIAYTMKLSRGQGYPCLASFRELTAGRVPGQMGSGGKKTVPKPQVLPCVLRVDDSCAVFKSRDLPRTRAPEMRCGGVWVKHPYICQQEEVVIGLLVLRRAEFERTRTLHLITYNWLPLPTSPLLAGSSVKSASGLASVFFLEGPSGG